MRHKLAIVTTGGTIATLISAKSLAIDPDGSLLKGKLHKHLERNDFEYEIFSPINKISENMEPSDWGVMFQAIEECIKKGYKRILITHGTDTLHYSSVAAALFYQNRDVRICFTGSFYPPDHASSDVEINLQAAIRCLKSDELRPGVYVVFRKGKASAYLFHAMDLKPMDFDDFGFSGKYGELAGKFSHVKGVQHFETNPHTLGLPGLAPDQAGFRGSRQRVRQILVYPGMDLSCYMPRDGQSDVLVLDMYHSGTAPADGVANGLIKFLKEQPSVPILMSAGPSKYLTVPYESTEAIIEAGGRVYSNLLPHQIYTYLLCGLAQEEHLDKLIGNLQSWALQL
jgi:L-asparaginase/Glu-tRNA(Gln) amidotransferase subunit D